MDNKKYNQKEKEILNKFKELKKLNLPYKEMAIKDKEIIKELKIFYSKYGYSKSCDSGIYL